MELWIRSQNKDFLEKCGGLYIAHTDENIWSIINSISLTIYGKYSTKERALEVLDEIQSKLKGTFLMKMKNNEYQNVIPVVKQHFEELNNVCIVTGDENFDLEPINKDIYVYEMPQE